MLKRAMFLLMGLFIELSCNVQAHKSPDSQSIVVENRDIDEALAAYAHKMFILHSRGNIFSDLWDDLKNGWLMVKEISYYAYDTLLFYRALSDFQDNNIGLSVEIMCKFCLNRPLECRELLLKVQTKKLEKIMKSQEKSAETLRNEMLSNYQEITKTLQDGVFAEVIDVMVRFAQQNNIACENCCQAIWQ